MLRKRCATPGQDVAGQHSWQKRKRERQGLAEAGGRDPASAKHQLSAILMIVLVITVKPMITNATEFKISAMVVPCLFPSFGCAACSPFSLYRY